MEFKYISSTQRTGRLLTLAGLAAVAVMIVGSAVTGRRKIRAETDNGDK